jgi:hypothetical protein
MRLLLACILAFLPLTAQAEAIDTLSATEFDPATIIDPFMAPPPDDSDSPINEWSPYGNPYSPSSATNFERISAPSSYDPGRQSATLYNPDWLSNPFGHYGNPYSPNQFSNR